MRKLPDVSENPVVLADDLPLVLLPDGVDIEEVFLTEAEEEVEEELIDERVLGEVEDEISLEEAGYEDGRSALRIYNVIGWFVLVSLAILFIAGWSYYQLPVVKRPFHYLHDVFRSSGTLGLSMGIAGTLLIVVSLIYLVRKRFVSWTWMGSLRSWMGFHALAGIAGPALILFHANFIPYSALGFLAFSAMIIVVGSGVVGRYIYVSLPKTLQGRELELEDLMRRLVVYRRKLIDLGVNPALLEIGEPSERSAWLIGAFMRVFYGDREGREEFERLHATISEKVEAGLQRDRILLLLQRLFTERQWLIRYQEIRKLMGAWRFFHRWLAIVLLFAVFFHIVIAVDFGDLWIFRGLH